MGRDGGGVGREGGGEELEPKKTTLMQMAMTSVLADRPPECLNTADDLRGHSYLGSHWQRVHVLLASVPFCFQHRRQLPEDRSPLAANAKHHAVVHSHPATTAITGYVIDLTKNKKLPANFRLVSSGSKFAADSSWYIWRKHRQRLQIGVYSGAITVSGYR